VFTIGVPVTVKPVEVAVFQIVKALPVSVMLPVPNAIVLALVLAELYARQVNVKLASDIVPAVCVNVPVVVSAAPSVKPSVVVLNDTVEQVAPAPVVQVPAPELASNVTVSAVVGADASGAPPEVADQLSTDVESHVPEPPTQKRAAIS
jgi:hypothetical protein